MTTSELITTSDTVTTSEPVTNSDPGTTSERVTSSEMVNSSEPEPTPEPEAEPEDESNGTSPSTPPVEGWRLVGAGLSCSEGCEELGLACDRMAMHKHSSEIDSNEEMEAVVSTYDR